MFRSPKLAAAAFTGTGVLAYVFYPKETLPTVKRSLPDVPLKSLAQVDEIMTQNQVKKSFLDRCMHINSVASNNPIEDTHSENFKGKVLIAGIFDGHSGTETSELLSKELAGYISHYVKEKNIELELQQAFEAFDKDLLDGCFSSQNWFYSTDQAIKDFKKPLAGSCALVAYLKEDDLYVACTGDSRAVLGKRVSFIKNGQQESTMKAVRLTDDQTAANPREYARMIEEHPGEETTVLSRGRVLGGLMPTRAFGDARYKWPKSILESIQWVFQRRIPSSYLTPPYVTAKPVVTHHKLGEGDQFLILATDGIWDEMDDETAVKVVSEAKDNAATAIIHAALGADEQHLLSIPAPESRRYRDDMTVNVLFFHSKEQGAPISQAPKFTKRSARLSTMVSTLNKAKL